MSYSIQIRKYARVKAKSGYAGVISKADEYGLIFVVVTRIVLSLRGKLR